MAIFITLLVVAILALLIGILLPQVNNMLLDLVNTGLDIGSQIPILNDIEQALTEVFFKFGITLIILKFIKKGFETYITWTEGDADSDPLSTITLFFKAIGTACCFKSLYDYFVVIINELTNKAISVVGDTTLTNYDGFMDAYSNPANIFGSFLALIFLIIFFIAYFKMLKIGIELMVLRIGFYLACTGLIDADKGMFKNYFMTLVKTLLTILIQVVLMKIGVSLLINIMSDIGSAVVTGFAGIACLITSLGTPKLLSEFMIPSGQGLSLNSAYYAKQMGSSIIRSLSRTVK